VEWCNPLIDSLPIWVDVMQCSVCKEYIEGAHGTNYCPNCGAKMDLPSITEQTTKALEAMDRKAHGGADNG
jgi:Zn finger protein HypA/HybF involved in hydrogenase expression